MICVDMEGSSRLHLHGHVYWIDRAGLHEGDTVQVTQEQLDEAVADAERPPKLGVGPVGDTEPRKRLVWRGKAPSSGVTVEN